MDFYKEYAVCSRKPDGSIRYSGRWYLDKAEAEEWFNYLCTTWREELKAEVEAEDLSRTNWAHMTWNDNKDDKFLIVERETTVPKIIFEED